MMCQVLDSCQHYSATYILIAADFRGKRRSTLLEYCRGAASPSAFYYVSKKSTSYSTPRRYFKVFRADIVFMYDTVMFREDILSHSAKTPRHHTACTWRRHCTVCTVRSTPPVLHSKNGLLACFRGKSASIRYYCCCCYSLEDCRRRCRRRRRPFRSKRLVL